MIRQKHGVQSFLAFVELRGEKERKREGIRKLKDKGAIKRRKSVRRRALIPQESKVFQKGED